MRGAEADSRPARVGRCGEHSNGTGYASAWMGLDVPSIMDGLTLDSPSPIRELIRDLCARQVPGWLRCEGAAQAIAGYFCGVDRQCVRFNLAGASSGEMPELLATARRHHIEFVHRGRARSFESQPFRPANHRPWWQRLARPAQAESSPSAVSDEGELLLQMPARVKVQHTRRAFRIPMKGLPRLQLQLSYGVEHEPAHGQGDVDVVDISAVGMAVRRSQVRDEALPWRLGQRLSAEIEFGRERVRVAARCERVTQELVGFVFPESLRDEEVQPPIRLARMLRELERQWLRRRVEDRDGRIELGAPESEARDLGSEAPVS